MATGSPLGISPALLQAISHLQRSRAADARLMQEKSHDHVIIAPDASPPQGSHILQGMNEPITTLSSNGAGTETIYVMPSDNTTSIPHPNVITVPEPQSETVLDDSKNVNMGSVLSALAKSVQQKKAFEQDENQSLIKTGEDSPPAKKLCPEIKMTDTEANVSAAAAALIVNSKFVGIKQDNGTIVYRQVAPEDSNAMPPPPVLDAKQMCPVCSDKISGYHYGTYTCESCKGFFKRTVQNKKSFVCHRKGDCPINMSNRKKCPACRFKLCLANGMRVEAIREDRARGGRSSYDGCSPHGRYKAPNDVDKRRVLQIRNVQSQQQQQQAQLLSPSTVTVTSDLSAVKIVDKVPMQQQIQPITPQLLEDLCAVESLMMEEEEEQPCCAGKLQEGDTMHFSSLLHVADHCLYKIVRWARNLPDFANVSTDDQILLLQNCWAELLVICTCWSSIRETKQLKLSFGRFFSLELARLIGLGELVERLLDFAEVMRQYEVDAYEFVAVKALLLLSPDVKNLKNEGVIRQQQELLLDAFMSYTTTHYPKHPEKFSRLLALLPQLSRSCILGKEQLIKRQEAGEVPSNSLLSELLKGDSAVQ